MAVDILILGAGWTSTFLIPLCIKHSITHAQTTRSGSSSSTKFSFDPHSDDPDPYKVLPDAHTVLITFGITKAGASERLVRLYNDTRHHKGPKAAFILLGSSGIWEGKPSEAAWYDRHSPFSHTDRAKAEQELLHLSPGVPTTVLNLAGLWGGSRSMRNWVAKVAPTKDALKNKGSIHLIHGLDVSRAILAIHANFSRASGQRWVLTDGRVYDWWDLASAWGSVPGEGDEKGPHPRWVRELMVEEGVRALPRGVELLGRALDSREFWREFGLSPVKALLEG